jgi:beta-N-acetylhexosaminidase
MAGGRIRCGRRLASSAMMPVRVLPATLAAWCLLVAACAGTSRVDIESSDVAATARAAPTTAPAPEPDCAELLPPAAQAGQMIMALVTSPVYATDALTTGRAGGVALKGRQSAQVGDEVAAAVADAPIEPFVASDEEGGTVQRLAAALGDLPSAAALGEGSPRETEQVIAEYAAEMSSLGFNMNFAPVADVGEGSDLGSRTYGDDPDEVTAFVAASLAAHSAAGVMPVVKHWPGIGTGETDPHESLDAIGPLEDLRESDMSVFQRAIELGAPAVMVGHVAIDGLTGEDEPASMSRAAITGELRRRQGFSGLVITDSLIMGAVADSVPQDVATERAIVAGADVALVADSEEIDDAHRRLTGAIMSGQVPQEQVTASVRRILDAKGVEGPCLDLVEGFQPLQQELAAEVRGLEPAQETDRNG